MKKIIVIGGGHAGIEAAWAIANLGQRAILITADTSKIGLTPCNPSIGGPAKGNVVVEIDALNGLMGRLSDTSMIQIKKLNRSKGPAVQAIRAQIDKDEYQKNAQKEILNNPNIDVVEDFVLDFIIDENKIIGVEGKEKKYYADSVILTTGTYMDSKIIKGQTKISMGPENTKTSNDLSNRLKKLGFELIRLKTGTPARIKKSSIDYTNIEKAPGDNEEIYFSHFKKPNFDYENQVDCHLTYTTPKTHEIILKNLHLSGIGSGIIEGVGARYCPSIEDKLKRFSDKERHQIFLEPEYRDGESIYVQGFSTSMPEDIQLEMLKSLPGCSNVEVLSYGYAIEYDSIVSSQLKTSLETKKIENLFTAGQINGTSGYEEAAGQGLIAGINATQKALKKAPLILSRSESYIGLMIDDIILKNSLEPYRLLTSRAEYRLFLRNDNADRRLLKKGYDIGLIDDIKYNDFLIKEKNINECMKYCSEKILSPKIITPEICDFFKTPELKHGITLKEFIKRPNVEIKKIKDLLDINYENDIIDIVSVEFKYEGYINKIQSEIQKIIKNEKIKLSNKIDYNKIPNLALEAREKLNKLKPETVGQASRISGVNPVDISVLLIYLKQYKGDI